MLIDIRKYLHLQRATRTHIHERWTIRSRMSGAAWRNISENEEDKDEGETHGLIKRRPPSLNERIYGARVTAEIVASTITIAWVVSQSLRKRIYYSCIRWCLLFLSRFLRLCAFSQSRLHIRMLSSPIVCLLNCSNSKLIMNLTFRQIL